MTKQYRRLTPAEITPKTFDLKMYAYFTSGSNDAYFLLPVTVLDYPGVAGEIYVVPYGTAIQFPSDETRGVWLPVIDIWIEEEKPTRQYLKPIEPVASIMSVAEWKRLTEAGIITELDGIGRWCKDGKEHSDEVFETSQEDATHVAWYKN